jgi:hypothetical protein
MLLKISKRPQVSKTMVMNTSGCLDYSMVNSSGNLDSSVMNTPGNLDSPVMNTPGSRLLGVGVLEQAPEQVYKKNLVVTNTVDHRIKTPQCIKRMGV